MKIVVYFDKPGIDAYPLSEPVYRQAYVDLSNMIKAEGHEMYIARSFDTYKGGGVFVNTWKFDSEGSLVETGEIRADVVYDKGPEDTFTATDVPAVNERELNILCSDKPKTHEMFPDISPNSFVVKSKEEFESRIGEIQTKKIVVKPIQGYGGEGVAIIEKSDVHYDSYSYPVLVQEFIDTSAGIPELAEGYHDLRIQVVNGKYVAAVLREPAEGSLLANVAQGGSRRYVPVVLLPEAAIELADKVDSKLTRYKKRVYSIDMAFEEGRPYLIELNSRLGISPLYRGVEAERFLVELIAAVVA